MGLKWSPHKGMCVNECCIMQNRCYPTRYLWHTVLLNKPAQSDACDLNLEDIFKHSINIDLQQKSQAANLDAESCGSYIC